MYKLLEDGSIAKDDGSLLTPYEVLETLNCLEYTVKTLQLKQRNDVGKLANFNMKAMAFLENKVVQEKVDVPEDANAIEESNRLLGWHNPAKEVPEVPEGWDQDDWFAVLVCDIDISGPDIVIQPDVGYFWPREKKFFHREFLLNSGFDMPLDFNQFVWQYMPKKPQPIPQVKGES